MNSKYHIISFNKGYLNATDLTVDIQNRAFRYGDGFFETMHANGLTVQFIDDHFNRILRAADLLKLQLPDYFNIDFLKSQISGLLSRCKLFQAARVKLVIYRRGDGLYLPNTNDVDVLIEGCYIGKGKYELNSQGINIGIYDEIKKPILPYMSIKALNAQLYILAGIFAKGNNYNDALILNELGSIVEATSSNFFAVKEKEIYTPSLTSGCVHGIMRKQIISIAKSMGYKVIETDSLKPEHLLEMDELFLTNAVVGIKFISGFEKRRYYNRNSKKLMLKLNELAFNSSQD